MSGKPCPKCRKMSSSRVECDSCGTVFEEYERQKQESIGQVYELVSAGNLESAKTLAEGLPAEFPDSKSDFLILLSNINRDINVTSRYQQALESFDRGDCSEAVLLLRNIKAFDTVLDEKVISLRRKAERYANHEVTFEKAVEKYDRGRFAAAQALFEKIDGYSRQAEVTRYLQRIDDRKNDMLRAAVNLLQNNKFDPAQAKFEELAATFPDMGGEAGRYLAVITKREEIKARVLAAGDKALQEKRFLESKVIFSFLSWQFPELRSSLAPYVEEIGSRAITCLADIAGEGNIDFAALGLHVNSDGFFGSGAGAGAVVAGGSPFAGQHIDTASVEISPEPLADTVNKSVDIDGEEVADFIC